MSRHFGIWESINRYAFAIALSLFIGVVSAQATGLLNSPTSGYLVCVNSKTKAVTHPGTSTCPKGNKKLILGAQGIQGLTGAAGLAGTNGKDCLMAFKLDTTKSGLRLTFAQSEHFRYCK